MVTSTAVSVYSETAFVACNIYISSASSSHYVILRNLLRRAQDHCRKIRGHESIKDCSNNAVTSGTADVAIIHAFADVPYNRSSFHLAGRSDCVADVALKLVLNSFKEIKFDSASQRGSAHPFVGLVDHVSVMPLVSFPLKIDPSSTQVKTTQKDGLHPSQKAAVDAAKTIGNGIINSRPQLASVHYYGLACPNHTSLADVRREKTPFFKSCHTDSRTQSTASIASDCTIGVPNHFVENFNIRLTPNVDFSQAKTLTQYVRGRNIPKGHGIEGVEALTLPYKTQNAAGEDILVYEVACNLTNPAKGSTLDIEEAVANWVTQQSLPAHVIADDSSATTNYFIDKMYRVGTSEEQCIDTLLIGQSNALSVEYWKENDQETFNRFENYLGK
eukprot:scaffold3479_cov76-Cyclotella_meneghiniana.AAC.2